MNYYEQFEMTKSSMFLGDDNGQKLQTSRHYSVNHIEETPETYGGDRYDGNEWQRERETLRSEYRGFSQMGTPYFSRP